MNGKLVRMVAVLVMLGILSGVATAQNAAPAVPADWQSLDARGLVSLSGSLASQGAAGQANGLLLAQYLASNYLSGGAAQGQSLTLQQWNALAINLLPDMSPDLKSQWCRGLRTVFAGDAATLAALSDEDYGLLQALLTALGDQDLKKLQVRRVNGLLKDAGSIKALGINKVGDEVYWTVKDVPEELRKQWSGRIHEAFAANEAAVAALSDNDFDVLMLALDRLGDTDRQKLQVQRVVGSLKDASSIKALGINKVGDEVSRVAKAVPEELRKQWSGRIREAFAANEAAVVALSDEDFNALVNVLTSLGASDVQKLQVQRVAGSLKDANSIKALGINKVGDEVYWTVKDVPEELRKHWSGRIREAFAANEAAVAALSDNDFEVLMSTLDRLGDTDRQKLQVQRVVGSLKDASSIKALGINKVGDEVSRVAKDVPDELRKQWSGRIREVFAANEAAVAALSDQEFNALVNILTSLGDSDRQKLQVQRVNGSLKDANSIKALGIKEVSAEVDGVAKDVPDELRKQWSGRIREAFTANESAVAALSDKDFDMLLLTLDRLGDTDRQNLQVQHVAGHLKDAGSIKALGINKVGEEVYWTAKDVPEELRKQWSGRISEAFAANESAVAALSDKDFDVLMSTLDRLGDSDLQKLKVRRVAGSLKDANSIKTLGVKTVLTEVAGLGTVIPAEQQKKWAAGVHEAFAVDQQAAAAMSEDDFELLKQLLNRLGENDTKTLQVTRSLGRNMADAAMIKSRTIQQWDAEVYLVATSLPAATRAAWVAGLRQAFAGDAAALANLQSADLKALIQILETLGDKKTKELTQQWMKVSEAWQSGDYAWILHNLPVSGNGALAARQQVAKRIEQDLLANPQATQEVPVDTWADIVRTLNGALSSQAKGRWVAGLRAGFLPNVSSLETSDQLKLTKMLSDLGDPKAVGLAKDWLTKNQDQLGSLSMDDTTAMIAKVSATSSQDALPLLQKLDAVCLAKMGNGQLAPSDMAQMAYAWYEADHWTEAQAWAWRMYRSVLGSEDARAKADEEALVAVSTTCYHVQGLINNDREHPAFATAAANLAVAGKLDELWNQAYYFNFGAMVMRPKSRAILQAALVDDQGNPRLPVAKILAWGYREGNQPALWRDWVAGQRDGASNADSKALWTAVLGYAEALALPNVRYTRWKTRLNEALALAQSDQVRLTLIDDTAACVMDMNWTTAGLSQLESIKAQFTGGRADHISYLQDKLRQREASRLATVASNQAGADVLRKQARLQDCQRLLAQATAGGDGASVSRLETTVNQLQRELGN